MSRSLLRSIALCVTGGCLGCALPQTGYDYTSSTVTPNGVPTGGFMTRQGSVLGGMPGVPPVTQTPTLAKAPANAPASGQTVPGGMPSDNPNGNVPSDAMPDDNTSTDNPAPTNAPAQAVNPNQRPWGASSVEPVNWRAH